MQIHLSLPGAENDPPEAEVLAHYQAYYNSCDHATVAPYPGVMEALRRVAAKYPVAIVSNKPDPAVKALCAQHFPGIYALGVTQDCPRKPDKAMVCKALEAIGADRCVYVGDSEVDVLTAKNAGAACLTVTWGFRDREDLVAAGAAHFCDDTKYLPQIIETIIQSRA
jgi:phosphoglycolate phosphatase